MEHSGSRAAAQHVSVPGQTANAIHVAVQSSHFDRLFHVVDEHVSEGVADGQKPAPGIELHRADQIVGVQLEQVLDVAVGGVPQVHAGLEGHGQAVRGAPIDQAQVIIVDDVGRVQNSLGNLANCPRIRSLFRRRRFRRIVEMRLTGVFAAAAFG